MEKAKIAENCMQIRMWNSCLDIITRHITSKFNRKLNPGDYYVSENIRGQSQVPSKIELKEMLQMTV